jgi:small subunit ribosomal protein S17e
VRSQTAMGNIRQTYIKRVAIELIEKYPDVFTDDFEKNKVLVAKLCDVRFKGMKNRIAGYATTYRRVSREKLQMEAQ